MPRVLQSIHLSDYQAQAMLIAFQAETPELAFAEMGQQDKRIESNLLSARDTLAKIGLLEIGENTIAVTPQGEEVMRDEYLINEIGDITEKGEELLQREEKEISPPADQGPSDTDVNDQQGPDQAPIEFGGEAETTNGIGESALIRTINDLAKLKG
jgi:hypothetical protein